MIYPIIAIGIAVAVLSFAVGYMVGRTHQIKEERKNNSDK